MRLAITENPFHELAMFMISIDKSHCREDVKSETHKITSRPLTEPLADAIKLDSFSTKGKFCDLLNGIIRTRPFSDKSFKSILVNDLRFSGRVIFLPFYTFSKKSQEEHP